MLQVMMTAFAIRRRSRLRRAAQFDSEHRRRRDRQINSFDLL